MQIVEQFSNLSETNIKLHWQNRWRTFRWSLPVSFSPLRCPVLTGLFFSIFLWYQLLVEFQWSSFQNREVLSSVFLRWITLVRHSRDLRVRIVNILWGVLLAWILIVCGIPWSSCQNRNHSLKRFPAVDISRVKRSSDHRVRIRERSSRRDNVMSLSAAKAWVIVLSHGINLLCF